MTPITSPYLCTAYEKESVAKNPLVISICGPERHYFSRWVLRQVPLVESEANPSSTKCRPNYGITELRFSTSLPPSFRRPPQHQTVNQNTAGVEPSKKIDVTKVIQMSYKIGAAAHCSVPPLEL